MPGWAVVIIATVVPTGVGIMGMLYRIGSVMGTIQGTLLDHERRLGEIEAAARGYPPRSNR